jgi:hypothetical protein
VECGRGVGDELKVAPPEWRQAGVIGDLRYQRIARSRSREALVSVTFAEDSGITTVTPLIDFGSKEGRDAAVATGMTDGMEQSYQLLDALLSERV